jgi:cation diffusion facilitator CzcD-associated flavoprotein CzcO
LINFPQYWKHVAGKWDIYRYITFNTLVVESRWNETESLWYVKVRDIKTGHVIITAIYNLSWNTNDNQEYTDCANVLIQATGVLNSWRWPDIPGLKDFKGHLVHSADWDHSLDVTGRKVALIGAGSSGIQILPNIQPKVERCDHYVKGKTWIAYRIPGKEFPGQNPDDLENCESLAG